MGGVGWGLNRIRQIEGREREGLGTACAHVPLHSGLEDMVDWEGRMAGWLQREGRQHRAQQFQQYTSTALPREQHRARATPTIHQRTNSNKRHIHKHSPPPRATPRAMPQHTSAALRRASARSNSGDPGSALVLLLCTSEATRRSRSCFRISRLPSFPSLIFPPPPPPPPPPPSPPRSSSTSDTAHGSTNIRANLTCSPHEQSSTARPSLLDR